MRRKYSYDKFGNLAARKDNTIRMEEMFTYDDMNRLTGIDLTRSAGQGGDSLRYSYGFDRQRMRVEEFSTGWSRTKDYVGRCEFVTESGASGTYSRSLTFVTGPCGVFAVVEDDGQTQSVHYVLKDNLGSWSVVTDGDGNVEQRLGYDAWGNPRDPSTWVNHPASGGFGKLMFYAYCMNNPLRFIDPTGYYVTYRGRHNPDGPLQQVVMDGHVGFVLPEVTVIADYENPINLFEFTYEPYNHGGGSGGYLSYGLNSNSPTIGPNSGGGGGGNGAKIFGAAGLVINWGCLYAQFQQGLISEHEGIVRASMSGIEYGLSFIPYAGPILSIGLTAFDIGGGFDNNLYKTDNWWKGNKP